MPPRNPFYALVGLDFIEGQLNVINRKLDKLLTGQQQGKELVMAEQEEIANLVQQVQANRDVAQSATTALQGLVQTVSNSANGPARGHQQCWQRCVARDQGGRGRTDG